MIILRHKKYIRKYETGFTTIELLMALGILALLITIVFSISVDVRKSQALQKDTETIVEILREARSDTLSSQSDTNYGVRFASSTITIFPGSSYSSGNPLNRIFELNASDTILTITLTGGGSNVVFNRLTGETSQNGAVVVSSPTTSKTKTVTIYKTGLVSAN